MSIHKRAPGKWKIVLQIRGRRFDRVIAGSLDDAKEAEARLRLELEPQADPHATPRFLEFSRSKYKPHAELHLAPATWQKVKYKLALLADHFGDLKLSEIGQDDVQSYKLKRKNAGIRATTINTDVRVLLRVLNYARECGVTLAPLRVKALPEKGQTRAKAWTSGEVTALMEATLKHAPAIVPLVTFLANTGCRKGEALALQWSNVDLARGLIAIHPSDEWRPKGNRPREIPISGALRPWLESSKGTTRWVFPCPGTGERYASWPQLQFDRAREAAGLTGGPHTLRHTFASRFLERCPDIYLLARILGHEDVKITMKHYAHLLPGHLEAARDMVLIAMPVTPDALATRIKDDAAARASALGVAGGKASGKVRRGPRAMRSLPESLPTTENHSQKLP